MKSIHKAFVAAAGLALLAGCVDTAVKYSSASQWVPASFAGPYLPLADRADQWTRPKPFNVASGKLTVQSKFTGQQGTTCKFDVQFNNVGSTKIDESVIVTRPGKAAVGANDIPMRPKLNPGASTAFGTEVRECPLIWGESKEMANCASCEPVVYFVQR